ncbi:MAG: Ig-like domain repeat protein, partial [Terracidiphilus sp.]
ALDSAGNLYVSDNVNAAAYLVARTNTTQSFGIWSPGSTSGTLSYYVENAGNTALTLGTPFYTATGDTAQFTLLSGESGACVAGGSVAVGSNCNLEAEFTPSTFGGYTDTLILSSNANVSGQQVAFTGLAATTISTTTNLTITSPTGAISYDQAVTLTAAVSASAGTPVGSVSLLVDGITKQTATLNGNSQVQFTLAAGSLSGGSHTLEASYGGGVMGSDVFSQSSSANLNVNVLAVATSTTNSFATLYIDPTSQPEGTAIVFTASVSSAYAGIPTGTVTFTVTDSSGTLVTGTGTLAPASGGTFQATYTYANTTSPATGSAFDVQSVVAKYSGDANFSSSSSASSSFDVSPASGDVVTTAGGTSITSSASSNGTVSFTATSYGGWNGMVGFSCDPLSLPSNARCIFSPGQVEVLASTSTSTASTPPVVMSVTIDQPPQTPTASKLLWWLAAPTGLLLLLMRRRATRRGWPTVAMVFGLVLIGASAVGLTACTSGEAAFVTPAGTTTVTVIASSTPFQSGSTTTMQSCPANDPASSPCAQQTFHVTLTVQ